jgi:hypothetical protein
MPLRHLLQGLRRYRRSRQRFRTSPTPPRTCLAVRRHADGAEIVGLSTTEEVDDEPASCTGVAASGSQHRGSRVLFRPSPRNHASVGLRSSLKQRVTWLRTRPRRERSAMLNASPRQTAEGRLKSCNVATRKAPSRRGLNCNKALGLEIPASVLVRRRGDRMRAALSAIAH